MQPKIKALKEKKLIGQKLKMSLSEYKVPELWKNFQKNRHLITNAINNDLISIAVYDVNYFSEFSSNREFERWAAVEVSDLNHVPSGMEGFILSNGLYAVFQYKGLSSDKSIYQYIFQKWIRTSKYELGNRPHFEVLGEKYKNNDPDSEEEIWIPIKTK